MKKIIVGVKKTPIFRELISVNYDVKLTLSEGKKQLTFDFLDRNQDELFYIDCSEVITQIRDYIEGLLKDSDIQIDHNNYYSNRIVLNLSRHCYFAVKMFNGHLFQLEVDSYESEVNFKDDETVEAQP